jgi:hypothetical protein
MTVIIVPNSAAYYSVLATYIEQALSILAAVIFRELVFSV